MEKFITDYFNQIKIGEPESFDGFQVFPLFSEINYEIEYLMMREAMNKGVLKVEEVSSSGSVPNLSAINNSDLPILLLGGEELEGAKQNRILNLSILLPPNKKTVIPVSCVERGRWSYKSRDFKESGNVSFKRMRAKNIEELYMKESFEVSQSRVWEDVDNMMYEMKQHSPTDAMKDVYKAKEKEISDYYDKITIHEGQIGIFVASKGKIMGFDIIGRADKFGVVFDKLLKSYIMEDIGKKNEKYSEITKEDVREFFDKVVKSKEKRIEGVGLGYDYRYKGDKVVGSVLAYNDEIIHAVFFAKENEREKKKHNEFDEYFRTFGDRLDSFDSDDF